MDGNEFIWDLPGAGGGGVEGTREAGKALRKAEGVESELVQLRKQVDRLTIACQAMWEILRDETTLTEGQLVAKIEEVDLRDGRADGKISTTVMTCWRCGARTNSRRSSCVMCGAEVRGPHVFEG